MAIKPIRLPLNLLFAATVVFATTGAATTATTGAADTLLVDFATADGLRTERRASAVRIDDWPGSPSPGDKAAIITINDIPAGQKNDNVARLFKRLSTATDWSTHQGDTLALSIGWKFLEKPRGRHRLFLLIQTNAGTANITLSPSLDNILSNDGAPREFTTAKSAAGEINWSHVVQVAVIIDGLTLDDSGEIAVGKLRIKN
ncbi:hypothetical protein [Geminisphaera colitermitum]|uniref:hypothetical protein n=1 Tax=Geminisphaera colitermitum TaxID=1148786 RepID=UPI0006947583|nr:hypothetical protein [Geminisphaera colitermitum]